MKQYAIILLLTLCSAFAQAQVSAHSQSNIHKFVVDEVLQTNNYTYLLANENGEQKWLALPKLDASVGEVYYYTEGFEMKDFKSTELNRVFESVYFLQGVQSAETIQSAPTPPANPTNPDSGQEIKVVKVEGAITIEELFGNKAKYKDKTVKITGKVVKYNSGIMGKNWIHLQDGTTHGEENDLTATTQMSAKVGDTITVEGIIVLDKDFGSGYFYALIMEKAEIVN